MGDAVVECALLAEEAIPLLRSISQEVARINAITEQISQIGGRADDLHDVGVRALFERRNGDAIPSAAAIGALTTGRPGCCEWQSVSP